MDSGYKKAMDKISLDEDAKKRILKNAINHKKSKRIFPTYVKWAGSLAAGILLVTAIYLSQNNSIIKDSAMPNYATVDKTPNQIANNSTPSPKKDEPNTQSPETVKGAKSSTPKTDTFTKTKKQEEKPQNTITPKQSNTNQTTDEVITIEDSSIPVETSVASNSFEESMSNTPDMNRRMMTPTPKISEAENQEQTEESALPDMCSVMDDSSAEISQDNGVNIQKCDSMDFTLNENEKLIIAEDKTVILDSVEGMTQNARWEHNGNMYSASSEEAIPESKMIDIINNTN